MFSEGAYTELLNVPFMCMPVGSLEHQGHFIFSTFKQDQVFIRPNSGQKSFAGSVVSENAFNDFCRFIQENLGCRRSELVLIAGHKRIQSEYRAIIIDRKVVSVSQYEPEKKITRSDKITKWIQDVVLTFGTELSAYALDIAELINGELRILEVNSLNCAGWYDNDIPSIVKAANSLAIKQWNEVNS